jgi:hypothetical protein
MALSWHQGGAQDECKYLLSLADFIIILSDEPVKICRIGWLALSVMPYSAAEP